MESTTVTPLALAPTPAHPTDCPSWCRERRIVSRHHFGPTVTWHWSPQYRLANPDPLISEDPVMLRAELVRNDEGQGVGETRLFVAGETDVELGAAEADIFIGQMQAFVDTLRIMRSQMG